MSDIFQEVEEDVRRERYEKLWKLYGNYLIAAAGVLVLAVAGFQAWRTYDLRQRQQVSDRFQAAQQLALSGNAVAAEGQFATLAQDAPGGYATLAKFHLAGAYLVQGKRDQGVALLRELARNSDPVLANTARMKLAWTLADADTKANIAAILQPMTGADNPWRFAAQEVLAYVDLRTGSRTDALAEFQKLGQDTNAPAALRQRALAIADFLKANPDGLSLTAPPPELISRPATPPTLPSSNPAPAPPSAAPAPAAPTAPQGTTPK